MVVLGGLKFSMSEVPLSKIRSVCVASGRAVFACHNHKGNTYMSAMIMTLKHTRSVLSLIFKPLRLKLASCSKGVHLSSRCVVRTPEGPAERWVPWRNTGEPRSSDTSPSPRTTVGP